MQTPQRRAKTPAVMKRGEEKWDLRFPVAMR